TRSEARMRAQRGRRRQPRPRITSTLRVPDRSMFRALAHEVLRIVYDRIVRAAEHGSRDGFMSAFDRESARAVGRRMRERESDETGLRDAGGVAAHKRSDFEHANSPIAMSAPTRRDRP